MPVSRMEQQRRRLYEMCAMAIAAGRADLDGASRVGFDIDLPVFSVGSAAELAAVHPQTLRQYGDTRVSSRCRSVSLSTSSF